MSPGNVQCTELKYCDQYLVIMNFNPLLGKEIITVQ